MLPSVYARSAFLLFLASFTLSADVIYTNFGADNDYAAGTGLIVTNDGSAWSSVAVGFTPAFDYDLTGIGFVSTSLFPFDTSGTIGIFADDGGHPGGSPLESFAFDAAWQFGTAAPVMTVTSLLQPRLLAATQYWIGMEGPAGSFIVWNQNSTGAGGFSATDGAGSWFPSDQAQGVLEINGTLVPMAIQALPAFGFTQAEIPVNSTPEPSTLWLAIAALVVTFASARRAPHPPKTTTR